MVIEVGRPGCYSLLEWGVEGWFLRGLVTFLGGVVTKGGIETCILGIGRFARSGSGVCPGFRDARTWQGGKRVSMPGFVTTGIATEGEIYQNW